METNVQKWGNSLGVRLPKAFADDANVTDGSLVDISLEDGRIVLTPIRKAEELDELLARVNANNRHRPVDFGDPRGQEIW